MSKELWIRADRSEDKNARKELVLSALESGITSIIVRPEDSDFASLGNMNLMFKEGDSGTGDLKFAKLETPSDQDRILALSGKCKAVILETTDWTIIPLENLIADFRNTGTKILMCANTPDQARLYFKTLEVGTDGIVIDVDSGKSISGFKDVASETGNMQLTPLKVTEIRNIEMGDRVCVDTVTMMHPGEGMLIGSQASCLFLVQSETEDNGYVAARPFRVNAGAVHAYIMGNEGKTRYLAELKSGDSLLIVDSDGRTRPSCVGRCKIEPRPLIILEATDGKNTYTTILQNAETVKLVGPSGSISVSEIKKDDEVYAKLESGGRHFGMKTDGTIREI